MQSGISQDQSPFRKKKKPWQLATRYNRPKKRRICFKEAERWPLMSQGPAACLRCFSLHARVEFWRMNIAQNLYWRMNPYLHSSNALNRLICGQKHKQSLHLILNSRQAPCGFVVSTQTHACGAGHLGFYCKLGHSAWPAGKRARHVFLLPHKESRRSFWGSKDL